MTLYQITPIKRKGKPTLMVKKALVHIPPELWNIIYDFKDRLEHRDRYSNMMPSIPRIRNILNNRTCILNTDHPLICLNYANWERGYFRQKFLNIPSIKNHTLLLDKVEDRDNDFLKSRFGNGYMGVMEQGGKWVSRRLIPIH
tara:strand:- start:574 stop:1002 length:429 start_codon:yes stop_codon:yes gene_type:complete